jgi:predicted MFS family arabinose efflux permease
LLAGALADLFDKRRMLLLVQILMAATAAGFAVLVLRDEVTAPILLVFTFLMATGGAFVAPAWQSIVPKLVERPLLSQAVALNSMGVNVARAIGPALAGLLIATVGIAAPFLIDAASFLIIIAALLWWRTPPAPVSATPPEHVAGAIVAGVRYAAHSPELKAVLVRSAGFFLFASAPMSLLPLVAREQLAGDAHVFGLLMAGVGVGAVAGALLLPKLKLPNSNAKLWVGAGLVAAASAAYGLSTSVALSIAASALFGLGWIVVLSTLNTAAQFALPDWVRARGLAIFTTVFFGAMTLGSLSWGWVAGGQGLAPALFASSIGLMTATLLLSRVRLGETPHDHTPSSHWPEPVVAGELQADRGPIMVCVRYRIDPTRLADMLTALNALEPARRRGGATRWTVFQDAADPTILIEQFEEASWGAHLRHHARVTKAEQALQATVQAWHVGPEPPDVTHWVAPDPSAAPPSTHPTSTSLG